LPSFALDSPPVDLQGMQVKFIYQGHRVKVKVTATKNSKFLIPTMYNFDPQ